MFSSEKTKHKISSDKQTNTNFRCTFYPKVMQKKEKKEGENNRKKEKWIGVGGYIKKQEGEG